MRPSAANATFWKAAFLAAALLLHAGCERTAQQAWSWAGDGPSRSGLLPLEDGVVLGNEAGALVRLGKDGAPRWRAQVGREVAARPAIVGDVVVAATVGGEWVAVSLDSGRERWRVGGKTPLTLPLASDDKRAYAVAEDGSVFAISGASGGTVWKLLPPRGLKAPLQLQAPPVLHDGRLFVALGSAGLHALQPTDGDTLWRRDIGEVVGFLVEGERVYGVTSDDRAFALETATGEVRWEAELSFDATAGPWLARGLLWAGGAENALVALDPQDGSETWRTTLPAPVRGGVADYRELVLVPTAGREGRLLGFRPGQAQPVIDVRADSALRTAPRVFDDQVLVQASDGRVIAWQVLRTTR